MASDKKVRLSQKKRAKKSKYPEIIQKLESHENTPQAIAEDNTQITTKSTQSKKRSNSSFNSINNGTKRSQVPLLSISSSTRATIKKQDFSLSKVCSKLPIEKLGQDAGNKIQVLSKPKPHLFQQEEKGIEELEESLSLLDYLTHSTKSQSLKEGTKEYDATHNNQRLLIAPTITFENTNINRNYSYQGRKRRGFTIGTIPNEGLVSKQHLRHQSDDTALRINRQYHLHVGSGIAQTLPHIMVQGVVTKDTFPPLKPIKKLTRSRLSSNEAPLNGTALNWYTEDVQSHTMQRGDSGLSMSFDNKYEELIKLLDTILKDLDTAHQNIDKLTKENIDLKKKHGNASHKQCQTEFLIGTGKLNKLADKTEKSEHHTLTIDTNSNNLLKKQLESTQLQVGLLKSTMQEFLRMGIFNDLLLSPLFVTPTDKTPILTPINATSKSSKPKERKNEEKHEEKNTKNDLDIELNQLLIQKEILQSEYHRLPSSHNALARKQRDEYESKLDRFDSEIYSLKFKMRNKKNLESV
ncbi:hypothetical protein K501DRAFT_266739 [Backusella circina FSU 941]|nr:hypothetical protein K501DRAFT_266739 [Backusella circina FSU 941]